MPVAARREKPSSETGASAKSWTAAEQSATAVVRAL